MTTFLAEDRNVNTIVCGLFCFASFSGKENKLKTNKDVLDKLMPDMTSAVQELCQLLHAGKSITPALVTIADNMNTFVSEDLWTVDDQTLQSGKHVLCFQ